MYHSELLSLSKTENRMKKSVLLMATLLIAAVGVLSYTFLYAGSTANDEGVDGKKTECSYKATSVEDCDWHKRSIEAKKSCDSQKECATKAECKGEAKADCQKKCNTKCDWESKHGAKSEESIPEVELN